MEEALLVLLMLAVAASGLGMTAWTFSRSRTLLNLWVSENGYQIVHSELRWWRRGHLFWTSARGQMVYHVVVRTPDDSTRRGWVRCGSFFWGLLQDRVEERWET